MAKAKIVSIDDLGTFEKVVATAGEEMQKIARDLRALVAATMPGVTEVSWARQKTVSYGVGPKKMSEHFCYIAPMKSHVNLGFYYGADLDDPEGLLEGTGKLLRHVKIRTRDEAKSAGVKKLLKQSAKHLPKLKAVH